MSWLILAAGAFAAGCIAIAVAAPHTPKLILEGYPSPVWPARGAFVEVAGAPPRTKPTDTKSTSASLPAKLANDASTRALLVFQRGKIVLEHYAGSFREQSRFNSFSMVKSLLGALVLKAHAEGQIKSLDDPLGAYLPGRASDELLATPLQAFLDMKSGLVMEPDDTSGTKAIEGKAEKAYSRVFGDMARLHADGVAPMLADLRITPGQVGKFSYQNVNTAILGAVLETVYRRPLHDILSEKIWRPAGAASAHWRINNAGGSVTAYCCLYATPSDWLRVGIFLNRNGSPGAAFLPDALWRRFMGSDLPDADLRRSVYSDHARHDVLDRPGEALQGRFVFFLGSGGQMTYLMPDKDLVVIRFAERMTPLHSLLYDLSKAGVISSN